ncbi:MAG: AzlC family ABC transporter permease [Oscillospiraceae bacterium]|nr:AzlC family ABC transporter permease [Oscillospiraceae bacterium]
MSNRNKRVEKALRAAFPASFPVLTGFFVLGLAYGLLMSSKGYGPLWILLYSSVCFCGSMQFAAIPFMIGEFRPLYVLLLSIMVNARHLFYGISMLEKYKGTGKLKPFLIYCMCDETFAINSSSSIPDDTDASFFYFFVTLFDWLYWIIAGVLGGLIGQLIKINTTGLDFALTALFVVLFIEQLKSRKNAICGVAGVVAAAAALFVFGGDKFVIPAMLVILAILLGGRKKLCD